MTATRFYVSIQQCPSYRPRRMVVPADRCDSIEQATEWARLVVRAYRWSVYESPAWRRANKRATVRA